MVVLTSYSINISMICDLCVLSSPEIGLGLTGFGVFFSFLGIIFFFDKGLIAMGNVIIFSSVFSVEFCGSESN